MSTNYIFGVFFRWFYNDLIWSLFTINSLFEQIIEVFVAELNEYHRRPRLMDSSQITLRIGVKSWWIVRLGIWYIDCVISEHQKWSESDKWRTTKRPNEINTWILHHAGARISFLRRFPSSTYACCVRRRSIRNRRYSIVYQRKPPRSSR